MDRQAELKIIRAAYAKQILAAARIMDNARLEAAFSATRREDFLGAGPWWVLRWFRDYVTTPDADPVYLYTNDLVGILPVALGIYLVTHPGKGRPLQAAR